MGGTDWNLVFNVELRHIGLIRVLNPWFVAWFHCQACWGNTEGIIPLIWGIKKIWHMITTFDVSPSGYENYSNLLKIEAINMQVSWSSPETIQILPSWCFCYITDIFLQFLHKDLLILSSSLLCELSEWSYCVHASALSISFTRHVHWLHAVSYVPWHIQRPMGSVCLLDPLHP